MAFEINIPQPNSFMTVNDLALSVDNKSQTDMIIMDFSKAFDSVPHNRLLCKLDHYGIRHNHSHLDFQFPQAPWTEGRCRGWIIGLDRRDFWRSPGHGAWSLIIFGFH